MLSDICTSDGPSLLVGCGDRGRTPSSTTRREPAMPTTMTPIPELVEATERVASADAGLLAALETWRLSVAAELQGLSQAFDRHVARADGPAGLYADTVAREPRLAHQVEVLRREERSLRVSL